jgi:hypothetical protein
MLDLKPLCRNHMELHAEAVRGGNDLSPCCLKRGAASVDDANGDAANLKRAKPEAAGQPSSGKDRVSADPRPSPLALLTPVEPATQHTRHVEGSLPSMHSAGPEVVLVLHVEDGSTRPVTTQLLVQADAATAVDHEQQQQQLQQAEAAPLDSAQHDAHTLACVDALLSTLVPEPLVPFRTAGQAAAPARLPVSAATPQPPPTLPRSQPRVGGGSLGAVLAKEQPEGSHQPPASTADRLIPSEASAPVVVTGATPSSTRPNLFTPTAMHPPARMLLRTPAGPSSTSGLHMRSIPLLTSPHYNLTPTMAHKLREAATATVTATTAAAAEEETAAAGIMPTTGPTTVQAEPSTESGVLEVPGGLRAASPARPVELPALPAARAQQLGDEAEEQAQDATAQRRGGGYAEPVKAAASQVLPAVTADVRVGVASWPVTVLLARMDACMC